MEESIDMNTQDYVYLKSYTCPVCGRDFKCSAIKLSKLKLVGSDTDLKPFYEPLDPLYYDCVVCQACGYSALSKEFNDIRGNQVKLIREHITSSFMPREYPLVYTADEAIERYKLALLCSVVTKAKESQLAYLCLKLSWLYRDKENEEKESRFTRYAYERFLIAYEQENFPIYSMDENTLSYLIGDLARRSGHYSQASSFLSKVVVSRNASQRLKDRALEARGLLKQQIQEQDNPGEE